MNKQKEVVLEIRQAEGLDATLLVDFLDQVGAESDYMTLDEAGIGMTPSDMERFLLLQGRADNRICLLLFLDQQLVGLLNITAAPQRSVRHIGEVFIVIQKSYWNQGLGQILLEEGVEWARSTGILRKLVLTVQVRNKRAVHVYQKLGFDIEGCQDRGAYSAEGEFLDVYLMGKLID